MPNPTLEHPIAYFCTEYALDPRLPIYAGGLGVLAGDTLKGAADEHIPLVGIGLLYRGESAKQVITPEGNQVEVDVNFDPLSCGLEHVYVDDSPLFIKVHLTQVDVWCRVWKKKVGDTVTLYLLDTETDQNHLNERAITHALYIGTEEQQLKQQMLLSIGGVKLLHAIGIHPTMYHVNEGRPSFLHWQLIRSYMDQHGMEYDEAKKLARAKTVYTNHTLVAAGNPTISLHLVAAFAQYYADKMGIPVEKLVADGVEADPQRFVLTRFALNTSRKASGVSQFHTALSAQQWPEYTWVNVTNGVHMPTWQHPEIAVAQTTTELWQAHIRAKSELQQFVQQRTGFGYDPNRLVVSWARRVAGYKQLGLLFNDVAKLAHIVSHPDRPIQLLISGKAHYGDTAGKELIYKIISYMKDELNGSALFIPDYNIEVAKYMVSGSDVWLNTPEHGKEASGTSGMKAIANGVLQCTVADGWAHEVDWQGTGWVLDHTDLVDHLYELLESDIAPLYYQRNSDGIPEQWVAMMQKSVQLSSRFSIKRTLDEYRSLLYSE